MIFNNSISDLLKENLIKPCNVDIKAITEFIKRAKKDLETSERNLNMDNDCSYTYSYNAMLHSGIALMNSQGYRPEVKDKHLTVIRFASVLFTDNQNHLLKMYNNMRKKRHMFIYEPFTPCSDKEAKDAVKSARGFVDEIINLILEKYPELKIT